MADVAEVEVAIGEIILEDDKMITEDGSSNSSDSLTFTTEEIEAVKATKALLMSKYNLTLEQISVRELLIVTMNSKLRPETAAEKYKRWLELIDTGNNINSELHYAVAHGQYDNYYFYCRVSHLFLL